MGSSLFVTVIKDITNQEEQIINCALKYVEDYIANENLAMLITELKINNQIYHSLVFNNVLKREPLYISKRYQYDELDEHNFHSFNKELIDIGKEVINRAWKTEPLILFSKCISKVARESYYFGYYEGVAYSSYLRAVDGLIMDGIVQFDGTIAKLSENKIHISSYSCDDKDYQDPICIGTKQLMGTKLCANQLVKEIFPFHEHKFSEYNLKSNGLINQTPIKNDRIVKKSKY